MYPDWLYEFVVGNFYKNFGALGLSWANHQVSQYLKEVAKGIIGVIAAIIWGTVFIYDYATGKLPTPIESHVSMDKGDFWYHDNNRYISFTNNYSKPVILTKVNLEIISCHNKNDKNYQCSHVTSYNNDFSYYKNNGVIIQPNQTIKLPIDFNETFLRNYAFNGYERDLGTYDVETIPEKQ